MRTDLRRWAIPALVILGLADSTYLSIVRWRGELPPCGDYGGCAAVNSSPYAEIFGVPVASFGMAMYAALLGVALWRVGAADHRRDQAKLAFYGLALASALFVVYLTAVEFFVIHDYCYWCLALAADTLLLLGLATREVLTQGEAPAGNAPGREVDRRPLSRPGAR